MGKHFLRSWLSLSGGGWMRPDQSPAAVGCRVLRCHLVLLLATCGERLFANQVSAANDDDASPRLPANFYGSYYSNITAQRSDSVLGKEGAAPQQAQQHQSRDKANRRRMCPLRTRWQGGSVWTELRSSRVVIMSQRRRSSSRAAIVIASEISFVD